MFGITTLSVDRGTIILSQLRKSPKLVSMPPVHVIVSLAPKFQFLLPVRSIEFVAKIVRPAETLDFSTSTNDTAFMLVLFKYQSSPASGLRTTRWVAVPFTVSVEMTAD